MKKNWYRWIAGASVIVVLAAGCSAQGQKRESEGSAAQTGELKGSITMAGSTSMEKFALILGETFMEKYPGIAVQSEFIGSSAGIEAVLSGSADIGNSSRNLKEEEKTEGAVENIVAIDGIAVITHPSGAVEDLTREQLISLFNGEITNWGELSGSDQPVVVVGREAGSGTREAFEEILSLTDSCRYSNELDSTGAVMAKVASTPGAVGYVSLDVLDDSVKTLRLNGVEASADNIKAGTYFLSRPFVMATKGELSQQSEPVKALFDFMNSDEGKELIKAVGLIPLE